METVINSRLRLQEVEVESMQELLNNVRSELRSFWSTQIPGLDKALLTPNETNRHPSLHRGDVIEIQGAPSSGKTHMIYHLLITCILPERLEGISNIGGWCKSAILFDCDATFDVIRFRTLLHNRLRRLMKGHCSKHKSDEAPKSSHMIGVKNMSEARVQELMDECLDRLHVFHIQSSAQLTLTLLHLSSYHATNIPEAEIGLVALDPVSGFDYWLDRFDAEQIRETERPGLRHTAVNAGRTSVTANSVAAHPLHHIMIILERFRRSHSPVVVFTTWGLNTLPDGGPFFKQHLHPFPTLLSSSHSVPLQQNTTTPNIGYTPVLTGYGLHTSTLGAAVPGSATSFIRSAPVVNTQLAVPNIYLPITHHITLHPQRIRRVFPTDMSLAEALNDEASYRSAVIRKGEVVGLVRSAAAAGGGQPREFSFCIADDEVLVDDLD